MTKKKTSAKKTTTKAPPKKAAKPSASTTVGGAKATKPTKAKVPPKDKKLSAIDAAAKVLAEAKEPMNAKAMIEAMAKKGYWTSPGGKTPHATLYTVVTTFPKTWRPGIDCCPETGCDRRMVRGGSRGKPLVIKGLPRTIPIAGDCHGRHKGHGESRKVAADASGTARVCRWSVGEAVVEPSV